MGKRPKNKKNQAALSPPLKSKTCPRSGGRECFRWTEPFVPCLEDSCFLIQSGVVEKSKKDDEVRQ